MAKSAKQQEMFTLIESWKRGEQTQQGFCKEHNLVYSAFHYWYKKYRQEHSTEAASSHAYRQAGFIPVHIQSVSSQPVAELILPDGKRLNFYQAVDACFLRALLNG